MELKPYHEDASVAVSVDAPQFEISLGFDCGSSGGSIDQRQLSKATSFSNIGHQLPIHVHLQTEQGTEKWRDEDQLIKSTLTSLLRCGLILRPHIPFLCPYFPFTWSRNFTLIWKWWRTGNCVTTICTYCFSTYVPVFRSSTRALQTIQAQSEAAAISPVDTLSTRLNNMERNQKRASREERFIPRHNHHNCCKQLSKKETTRKSSVWQLQADAESWVGWVKIKTHTSVPKQLHRSVSLCFLCPPHVSRHTVICLVF